MEKRKDIITVLVGVASIIVFFKLGDISSKLMKSMIQSEMILPSIAHILTCVLTGVIICAVHRFVLPLMSKSELRKPYFKASALGFIGVVSVVIVTQSLVMIIDAFIDCSLITSGNISPGYSLLEFDEKIITLISVAVAAPIIEEIMFRGLIFSALNKLLGLHIAAVVSSLTFGVLHGTSLFTVIGTTSVGLVLAYVYGIYGNLSNCICIHALYNFLVVSRVMISEKMILDVDSSGTVLILIIAIVAFAVYGRIMAKVYKQMRRDLRKKQRGILQTC